MADLLYRTAYQPDPRNARDVLAFVLTPVRAFVQDEAELEAVTELLDSAKAEAIKRWYALSREGTPS